MTILENIKKIEQLKQMHGTKVFWCDFAKGLLTIKNYETSSNIDAEQINEDRLNLERLCNALIGEYVQSVCGMYGWVRLEETYHADDEAYCSFGSHNDCVLYRCNHCDQVWSTCGDMPMCPNLNCGEEDFETLGPLE